MIPHTHTHTLWSLLVLGLTIKVEEPKYKKDKQLNEKISLFRGDITKLEVDAIVNAGEWTLAGLSQRPRSSCHLCSGLSCQAHGMPPGSSEARGAGRDGLLAPRELSVSAMRALLPLKP